MKAFLQWRQLNPFFLGGDTQHFISPTITAFAVKSSFPFPAAELSFSCSAGFLILFFGLGLVFFSFLIARVTKVVLKKSQVQASAVIFSLGKWMVENHRCGRCELLCLSLFLYFFNYQKGCSSATLLKVGQDLLEEISQFKPSVTQPFTMIYNFFTHRRSQGHLLSLLLAPTRWVCVKLLLCSTHCHALADRLRGYAQGELPHYSLLYVII